MISVYTMHNLSTIHAVYQKHKNQCGDHTGSCSYCRSRSSPFRNAVLCSIRKYIDKSPGCQKTDCRIKYLFNNLRNRCRHHISICLEISSEHAQDSGQENGRRKDLQRKNCIFLIAWNNQSCPEETKQCYCTSNDHRIDHSSLKELMRIPVISQSNALGNQV